MAGLTFIGISDCLILNSLFSSNIDAVISSDSDMAKAFEILSVEGEYLIIHDKE